MANWLKALSVLTGSSEELLLQVKKEINALSGEYALSNRTEKQYIINLIEHDIDIIKKNKGTSISQKERVYIVLCSYIDEWPKQRVQVLNRVLVHYFGYQLGNMNTLDAAIQNLCDALNNKKGDVNNGF